MSDTVLVALIVAIAGGLGQLGKPISEWFTEVLSAHRRQREAERTVLLDLQTAAVAAIEAGRRWVLGYIGAQVDTLAEVRRTEALSEQVRDERTRTAAGVFCRVFPASSPVDMGEADRAFAALNQAIGERLRNL